MSDLNELLSQHAAGNGAEASKTVEQPKEPVAETTPVQTATPVTTPATEPVQENVFSKINEGWKSEDDVKAFVSEHNSLKEKYTQLESEKKSLIKPANDYVAKLNEIASKGGDVNLFQKVNSIDIDKLSNAEKVVHQLMWQKGLTYEQAVFKVNRQYMINAKEKSTEDAPDAVEPMSADIKEANFSYNENIKAAKIDLDIDAKEAESFLKGQQVKASQVPDIENEQKERVSSWTPNVPNILNEAGKLTLKLNIGTKEKPEEIDFDYSLDKNQQSKIGEMLNATINSATNFAYNAESHKYAKEMATKWAIGENFNEITDAMSKKLASHYEEKYRKMTGATVRDKADTPVITGAKSPHAALLESLS